MAETKRERTHLQQSPSPFNKTHRDDGAAVRVRIPGLLVNFQGAFRCDHPNEGRHFRRQMVDLVGVLACTVFAAQQRMIFERFIL